MSLALNNWAQVIIIIIIIFWFYGPVNPKGLCRARSVYLTTLFSWAGLVFLAVNLYLCPLFRQKFTAALLESTEGREWPQRKNAAGLGVDRTRDLLITSRTRIRLSHQGRHLWKKKCTICILYSFGEVIKKRLNSLCICIPWHHFIYHMVKIPWLIKLR